MSVTLACTGVSNVVLPNPTVPVNYRTPKNYPVTFQTDGGVRYGYNKGVIDYISDLNFVVTSQTVITNLIALWVAVDGQAYEFSLTDWDTNTYTTTRFNHQSLEGRITEVRDGSLWRVRLGFVDQGT